MARPTWNLPQARFQTAKKGKLYLSHETSPTPKGGVLDGLNQENFSNVDRIYERVHVDSRDTSWPPGGRSWLRFLLPEEPEGSGSVNFDQVAG